MYLPCHLIKFYNTMPVLSTATKQSEIKNSNKSKSKDLYKSSFNIAIKNRNNRIVIVPIDQMY